MGCLLNLSLVKKGIFKCTAVSTTLLLKLPFLEWTLSLKGRKYKVRLENSDGRSYTWSSSTGVVTTNSCHLEDTGRCGQQQLLIFSTLQYKHVIQTKSALDTTWKHLKNTKIYLNKSFFSLTFIVPPHLSGILIRGGQFRDLDVRIRFVVIFKKR